MKGFDEHLDNYGDPNPSDESKIIDMTSSGLFLAVPTDDKDNRAFLVCEDCKAAFELIDPKMIGGPLQGLTSSLQLLPRLMQALHHVQECPYDGPKVGSDEH